MRRLKIKWLNVLLLAVLVSSIALLVSDGITILTSMFSYTKSLTTFGIVTDLIAMFVVTTAETILRGE